MSLASAEFDKDKSGTIDKEELAGVLEKLGVQINEEELDTVFRYFDKARNLRNTCSRATPLRLNLWCGVCVRMVPDVSMPSSNTPISTKKPSPNNEAKLGNVVKSITGSRSLRRSLRRRR